MLGYNYAVVNCGTYGYKKDINFLRKILRKNGSKIC